MLYQLKQLFQVFGLQSRALYGDTGRRSGAEIQWRKAADHIIRGAVCAVRYQQTSVLFFVADDADTVQRQHILGRFYETEELQVIGKYFSGGNFADIGTNVGNHAIFALRVLGADRVFCFEPNPQALSILHINIKLNDLVDRIQLFEEGLSDHPGEAGLIWDRNNLGSARVDGGADGARIRMSIGDERLFEEHIDFIKVDTEGFEINVLNGLSKTIAKSRPTLFVEVSDRNRDAFDQICVEHRYSIAEEIRRYEGNTNLLAIPSEKES